MKKTIKRIALTITILLALIGASGTVAFGAGYIQWSGSSDFQQTLVNLNLISERGQELQNERDTYRSERDSVTSDRDRIQSELDDANATIITLENEIAENNQQYEYLVGHLSNFITDTNNANGLRGKFDLMQSCANTLASLVGIDERVANVGGGQAEDNQLKQAEEDMADVMQKSLEVLEGLD